MVENNMYDLIIVGCGLTGMVIAREQAENGKNVHIVEKRNHIGGNIFDYIDSNGILVQKYGPHVFFTDNIEIEKYINRFCKTIPFYAECRTMIGGQAIPMPFNFASIDIIYKKDEAEKLKNTLIKEFGEESIVSVLDVLNSKTEIIHNYGLFMYEKEYRKYTAKQWARPIEEIDPSIFMRVPVYISYKKPYLKQKYQYMTEGGFTELSKKILDHKNISVDLNIDANSHITVDEKNKKILYDNKYYDAIVYTGPIDALFGFKYGRLPYRALEFTWKVIPKEKTIKTPLCAFPESDKYIRITDYTQFPPQNYGDKAVIAIEYPLEYKPDELCGNEPYYPVITEESKKVFEKYKNEANQYSNLFICGRLADFKYYNMDSTILRAKEISSNIGNIIKTK